MPHKTDLHLDKNITKVQVTCTTDHMSLSGFLNVMSGNEDGGVTS